MRLAIMGIGMLVVLAACDGPPTPARQSPSPGPANAQTARARLQLEARLGGPVRLTGLRHGANEDKAVLCGQAVVGAAAPTPFVMRGGYVVLPADASPEQFATLQSFCTRDGAAPAS
jgi:hypothetical protein